MASIAGHWRCLDCEPALAGVARNYFSLVGEYHCLFLVEREIAKCRLHLSMERRLVAALPAIPPIGSAPALEFLVKVGQLIDGIGAADLFVGRLSEPRKSLFEQLKHPLDKGSRWAIVFGHRITLIVFVVKQKGDSKFRAISAEEAELHGNRRRRPRCALDFGPDRFEQMDAVMIR
jgi:hypothetical protein